VGLVNGVGLMGAGLFQFIPGLVREKVAAGGLVALQEGLLIYVIWPVVALLLLLHLGFRMHRKARCSRITS
jgi:hypothetical protein